ncbi:hypothetical protein A2641_03845 [Candidatus Nomurabacteria bacterium RIFCSPHIGHO2_01_FULL_37_25]|uniref:Ada DNA repair metal-binding domain-containing protein n=1 Tax=Candidatus Nomurabacteria bacterium RIFCSPLOWO2_01_FULL_36_16 TaxID=1801767 RepID=A0A1F6WY53_9BACT|nr:MAG: hypothetical protein A2641_03845 [Candidatus Nomurabacteria bacterium RIFCSPHIGHO2_01_FULL_37_25]OGI75164.1 MAG: hypothetical protein A3D36_01000 [Candidatus Nomurabacteria bacterium RIFCSPHIGHO2_02_FULL_36_29]OGI86819.1 MAG: hypothetical protein A3A91_01210 [Candidatus Nomurabacteria bacterium RIFCSPLOWO2_01_FULL_36_16]OGI95297.1 MAG: hypothetical protein A3I84_01770 [Candidatus Nomurabacteria bacterium RIFCSPLOWO2_02_FULL_36_8]
MEKIKQIITYSLENEKGKDILIVLIVILLGLGSFELGRLSKNNISSGIKIEYPNQETNVISATDSISKGIFDISTKTVQVQNSNSGKNFFASNRGSKYYSFSCSAGKTIKQENRVYFFTREEAEKAGYEFSSSCK